MGGFWALWAREKVEEMLSLLREIRDLLRERQAS